MLRVDYDMWAKMGNTGWSWDEVCMKTVMECQGCRPKKCLEFSEISIEKSNLYTGRNKLSE